MERKNTKLRQAFEQIEKQELESLPEEEQVVRAFSENFTQQMKKILENTSVDSKAAVKRRKIKWSALVAAVLMAVSFTFTASGFLRGEGMWKLLNFTSDPEEYESIDIEAEGVVVKEGDFDTLTYTGKPITIKYTIDTGKSWDWPDRGLMIYLNGVRQTFDARIGDKEHKNTDMLHIQNEQGDIRSFEFTFEPNIGRKGDEMYLSVVAIFDPEVTYYPQCKAKHKELFVGHRDDDNDGICDKCSINIDEIPSGPSSYTFQNETMIRVLMEEDAPVQTKTVADFSGMKVDELNERIYKSYKYEDSYENKHNDYDTMQSLAAVLYKSVRSSYVSEWGVDVHKTRIETRAKENDDFTVNLHGATGKYRVSLYINNEIQSVFDGSAYMDVDIVHGKQTELEFNLDTTKLPKGDNYCYVLFQKLDGETDAFSWIHYGLVYTIEVK